ncbi:MULTISPECIES: hypothetical protein [Zymobacter]|uniref:Pyridoxal/pyridoxine/pyridoxamine kinase n=1 Tax=Zymobacter palmae TaxID=33074 RepID=A0A348HGD0_9GAMM|nr:hypothetical protein [Zymobacter palmae]BBG30682.1 pyridoxal/pyridoxine/pyridoxamine kinase [Zymobacter palmae]
MKKMIAAGVLCSMVLPAIAVAEPFDHRPDGPEGRPPMHHQGPERGGPGGPREGGFGPDRGPAPGPMHRGGPRHSMPRDAEALLIGGITYYLLDGLYYQHRGSEYITVAPPPDAATSMTPLDYKGRRYYVQHGHYYSRTPGGQYVEISRPQGL